MIDMYSIEITTPLNPSGEPSFKNSNFSGKHIIEQLMEMSVNLDGFSVDMNDLQRICSYPGLCYIATVELNSEEVKTNINNIIEYIFVNNQPELQQMQELSKGLLLCLEMGHNYTLMEINEQVDNFERQIHSNADVVITTSLQTEYKDSEMKFYFIATGMR